MNRITPLLKQWHWIHTWSAWERFERRRAIYYAGTRTDQDEFQDWQKRSCTVCHKTQMEKI